MCGHLETKCVTLKKKISRTQQYTKKSFLFASAEQNKETYLELSAVAEHNVAKFCGSMIELGNLVKTPYGEGIVVDFRRQQLVVEPTTWKMAGGQKPTFYMNPADVRPVFRVGDAVRTVYGPGEIVKIRESDGFYVVHMRDWKLASGQSPVLYLDERALRIEKVAGVSLQVRSRLHITINHSSILFAERAFIQVRRLCPDTVWIWNSFRDESGRHCYC